MLPVGRSVRPIVSRNRASPVKTRWACRKDDRNTADRVPWCWQDSETKSLVGILQKDRCVQQVLRPHLPYHRGEGDQRDYRQEYRASWLHSLRYRQEDCQKVSRTKSRPHDMVIMGVGQENSADWFVDVLYCLTNSFPMATRINDDEVLFHLPGNRFFISNRIHGLWIFILAPILKERTWITFENLFKPRQLSAPQSAVLSSKACG